jgi:hypothetical protein
MLKSAAKLETPERAHALLHHALVELLPGAMMVLERRRCANTLLYGKCAPHEVEWSRQLYVAHGSSDASARKEAQFTGYEAYLRGTQLALYWLGLGRNPGTITPPTAAQTQLISSCAVTACEMMNAPRPEHNVFEPEAELAVQLTNWLPVTGNMARVSPEYRGALAHAALRLMLSGVLEERGMDDAAEGVQHESHQIQAKAEAEQHAPGRQSCAHCGAREVHAAQFKRCSACKTVVFCGKDCQLANWPAHKAACKAARKAAAASGAAAGT